MTGGRALIKGRKVTARELGQRVGNVRFRGEGEVSPAYKSVTRRRKEVNAQSEVGWKEAMEILMTGGIALPVGDCRSLLLIPDHGISHCQGHLSQPYERLSEPRPTFFLVGEFLAQLSFLIVIWLFSASAAEVGIGEGGRKQVDHQMRSDVWLSPRSAAPTRGACNAHTRSTAASTQGRAQEARQQQRDPSHAILFSVKPNGIGSHRAEQPQRGLTVRYEP
jgi:hypothetical protein